jgi:hypothetical protein
MASPAIVHAAFVAIGMAAVLWALRPLKPAPSVWRQGLGWGVGGLMFGAALLAAGPLALLTFALPVLTILLLLPNRSSHMLGYLAAFLLGLLTTTPWILYSYEHDPTAWSRALAAFAPAGGVVPIFDQARHRLLLMLASLLPWTLWLVGAVMQLFGSAAQEGRPRLVLCWTWLLTTAAALLFLPMDGNGDLLPILPAGAVLIGQLFSQYVTLAAEGRFPRFWHRLGWSQVAVLVLVSVAGPVLLSVPRVSVGQGLTDRPFSAPMPWPVTIALMTVLLGILLLSVRWMLRHYPGRALAAWALWMAALLLAMVIPVARGPAFENPLRKEGRDLGRMTDSRPVFLGSPATASTASEKNPPPLLEEPDPTLVLYSRREIPAVTAPQISEAAEDRTSIFLLSSRKLNPSDVAQRLRPRLADLTLKTHFEAAGMNLYLLSIADDPRPHQDNPDAPNASDPTDVTDPAPGIGPGAPGVGPGPS